MASTACWSRAMSRRWRARSSGCATTPAWPGAWARAGTGWCMNSGRSARRSTVSSSDSRRRWVQQLNHRAGIFDRLVWRAGRALLDDLVFRLQHTRNDAWELGEDCFIFYKIKPLVDQYARFWATRPGFRPQNVFELGIWDGGSIAFWFEHFQPARHVGVEL